MNTTLMRYAACLAIMIALPIASAATLDPAELGLYNTGVDAGGVPLADDAVDPHWTLSGVGAAAPYGPDAIVAREAGGFPIGPWLLDAADPASAWITPSADTSGAGATDGSAIYTFSTAFTTPLPGSIVIAGVQSTDNQLVGLTLDGVDGVFTPVGFNTFADFSIAADLTGTDHVLQFRVVNGAGEENPDGPIGLRVRFDSVDFTPIPEPAALTLLALGAWTLRRRR